MDKQQEAAAAAAGSVVDDSVSMKSEYPTHEVFVSEPPPAYKLKSRPTSVQIARIAAFTVVACTFILGSFMLAAAYLQANASCSQLLHAEALLRQSEEAADRPQFQALVDPLQSDESSDSKQEELPVHQQISRNVESQQQAAISGGNEPSAPTPVQVKLPMDLDLEGIIGNLLEKNQRSRMNCVVEKKRAEEVMDHQPKTVRLPFGLNITTDPRFEHVTGERISIICESGHDERRAPSHMERMSPHHPMMMPIPMGHNPMTHLPNMIVPPPPPPPHHQMPPHPQHNEGPVPLAMIARINADIDNQLQMQEQQQIEEHIIPIFQQLLPELRSMPEQPEQQQQSQQEQKQEVEDRAMPNKVLYHPAIAEGRALYTVAVSEKDNNEGPHMSHQSISPEHMRQHLPMFQRVPINVPVQMMIPHGADQQIIQQDSSVDESKPEEDRPHYVHPR
ncbi:uncharacterized protein LOC126907484 [Daktulosphaira vitifoliae]|uniref:uncharacterized protein LOC126907484 n=1 Tax=Daktulosphaira vitifoliae TaxID=58002 RepID=UPI0021AAEC58|nr:uncharacterized protein LOC126907484 [Daktulosphaira vitifoliae]